MNATQWDREFDAVIIGSGAAGMAAALAAQAEGLSVLIVEKSGRIGGSTAISGGVIWAPANSQAAGVGHPDSVEKALDYLAGVVGAAAPEALQRRFVQSAGPMVDWFARHTSLKFAARSLAPDYYPDHYGAALGGRAMDPLPFDGRRLGTRLRELRDPLAQFMVLGGMMVNTADVRHLLALTRSFASWRHAMRLVLRYATDRLRGYHRGTRLVLGNALAGALFHSVLERGIEYWLSASVQGIETDPDGVRGVTLEYQGKRLKIGARRGIVVATGGFPWHAAMRQQHFPQPSGPWSVAPVTNCGDGIGLALQAGAAFGSGHVGAALMAPVSVHQRADGNEVRYPHLVWERAKPGLIAVDGNGRRFVNESCSYHEFVRAMYRSHQQGPTIPAYLVCDRDFMRKWGLGLALPGRRSRRRLIRDGYLHRASSLPELARKLGLDHATFDAAVSQFNCAAELGRDDLFGKGSNAYHRHLGNAAHFPNPCLGPLLRAPFYAIAVYPGDIGTALGIACNEHGQALGACDEPRRGLYVVGNDMHSVMGGHYPSSGITLGPALTFGWLAGRHLAQSHLQQPEGN